jgi:hypothetical protein
VFRKQQIPLQVAFHDDPKVVKETATEDYSVPIMPRRWRSGRMSLLMAWSGMFRDFAPLPGSP